MITLSVSVPSPSILINPDPGFMVSPSASPPVNPPLVDISSMLISAEEIFLVFSEMSFFISGRLLLLVLSQSSGRLIVTVALSSSIRLTISSFSGSGASRDSISATTASVFSSVDPAGILTLNLKSGVFISCGLLRLNVRLIRRAVKNTTSVPIIVEAGFLILALSTR